MAEENTAVATAVESAEEQQIVSHQVTGDANAQSMNDLLESGAEIRVLKPGDMVEGTMISVSKNEVYIDLAGYGVGVVRGRELYDDQATLNSLKPGDRITASVVETENRDGNVELSLRVAGQERVWQKLRDYMESKEIVSTKILAANKGGLMIELNNVTGFLPVSQLSLEHYPRVEDGDKNKILSILNSYVGTNVFFMVPREGIEPSIPCGPRILSPVRIPVPPPRHKIFWRCRRESNPCIEVLQTPAFPLRHCTKRAAIVVV
jgi:predicted RNA-binding protein with RPS1 domain